MPDPRTDLRGAVARSDGLALVALLTDRGGWPVNALQLAGDGLLGAVAAPVHRTTLDRHPNYILAAYMASGT